MTQTASGRTPPAKNLGGEVRLKREARVSPRENTSSQEGRKPTQLVNRELESLLAAPETRLVMEADNVGREELVAALTSIPIPHPRRRKR
jgi:hypothetical protein